MSVTEKYRGLSREQLLETAFALGVDYEKYSGSCSQCTAAALREILGFEDAIVRVSASSCGGHAGLATGTCGAIVGGTIVLDYYLGRPASLMSAAETIPESHEALSRGMEASRALCGRFTRQYGSFLCPGIQERIYGRSFNLQDPAGWQAFMDAGAHSDPSKCMSVVGNAARWTLEILMDRQAVRL